MGTNLDFEDRRYIRSLFRRIRDCDSKQLDFVLHDTAHKLHEFVQDTCETKSQCAEVIQDFINTVVVRGEAKERAIAIWLKQAVKDIESDIAGYRRINVEPDKETLEMYNSLKRELILT
jgi:hypothetical protein